MEGWQGREEVRRDDGVPAAVVRTLALPYVEPLARGQSGQMLVLTRSL
jgi:hypothetical protein